MSQVSIRPATPEDGRFVADSWLRSFKGAYHVKHVPAEVYWRMHRAVVADIVDRSEVWIACDPHDPWTIWGWMCAKREAGVVTVHYVYVKDAFRGFRVGSSLVQTFVEEAPVDFLFYSHHTKGTKHFLLGLKEAGALPEGLEPVYNPYTMYR